MNVLISLCNKKPSVYGYRQRKPRLLSTFLFLADTRTGTAIPVKVRWLWRKRPKGVTGLCGYKGGVLALFNSSPTQLIHLALPGGRIIQRWPLRLVHSPHSVAVRNDRFYVASTGTDAVIEYDPATRTERIYWQDNDRGTDSIHVNSVFWLDDELHISAFSPRPEGGMWKDATDGYIKNVHTGRKLVAPLHHPHSAHHACDSLFCCESSQQRVHSAQHGTLEGVRGYARGLAVTPEWLMVGVSTGRKCSDSTGRDQSAAASRFRQHCGVELYRRTSSRLAGHEPAGYIDLYEYGDEIYDLCVLPETAG